MMTADRDAHDSDAGPSAVERDVLRLARHVKSAGRRYGVGEAVLTFGELASFYDEQTKIAEMISGGAEGKRKHTGELKTDPRLAGSPSERAKALRDHERKLGSAWGGGTETFEQLHRFYQEQDALAQMVVDAKQRRSMGAAPFSGPEQPEGTGTRANARRQSATDLGRAWSAPVDDLLLWASRRGQLHYQVVVNMTEGAEDGTGALVTPPSVARLRRGVDDDVMIVCPESESDARERVIRTWRSGKSHTAPVQGAEAPTVDLDEGECRYVLIEATTMVGERVVLVRGYSSSACTSFAQILQVASPPLAMAGYTAIRCAGGGYALHERLKRCVRLSGTTADFGTADHRLAAQILQRNLGSDLRVLIASVSMFGLSGDFEEYTGGAKQEL
jgi:hypothetical protein